MKCTATTRKGEPCKSTSVGADGLCYSHSQQRIPEESRDFGGAQPNSGRPSKLKSAQALAEAIQHRAEELLSAAITLALAGDTRMLALLFAYGWGRPRQSMEITGAGGGPITIADLARMATEDLEEA